MDLPNGVRGPGHEGTHNSEKGKKQFHRHTIPQIHHLETFYKGCPHPDKNQRQQLGRELGLDPEQIKFWFQNKRTQIKAKNEKEDSSSLRTENEKICTENLAMQATLKNILCRSCAGSCRGGDEHNTLLQLRTENMRLKKVHEQAITAYSDYMRHLALPSSETEPLAITTLELEHVPQLPQLPEIPEMDKSNLLEVAFGAFNELKDLINAKQPMWVQAPDDGRYMLNRDTYDMFHLHPNRINTASARFESSKDSGVVGMAAIPIVEILLDANRWKEMFPSIISTARTIEVLDTSILGGSIQLMHERVHVLSPLVAPREFYFIRYCKQVNPSTWLMADVSYDFSTEFQDATRAWKLPSGCMIEDLSNGSSFVTWIEHVKVDDMLLTHNLYRDLVCTCQAYGARRWIATLQRMSERYAFSMSERVDNDGVIVTLEGRRNVMKLSHRMVMNFCEELNMSGKGDFPDVLGFENGGVRVSIRNSTEAGQLEGIVMSVASSIWLPLLKENVFEFLNDVKKRDKWDVLSGGNPVCASARVSSGSHPGNCISLIQPLVLGEPNLLMLQESRIDSLGALIIYAPIDLRTIVLVANGEDSTKTQILPSGFIISGDGRGRYTTGASSSSSTNTCCGSLLTVAYQILVSRGELTQEKKMESAATVHAMISSTIQKIKIGLGFRIRLTDPSATFVYFMTDITDDCSTI